MSLKIVLRAQICRFEMRPYYPLHEFMEWAFEQRIATTRLLQELDELQKQLDVEAEALRRHSDTGETLITQQECWCCYCEQVRAHYQMLLRLAQHAH